MARDEKQIGNTARKVRAHLTRKMMLLPRGAITVVSCLRERRDKEIFAAYGGYAQGQLYW